MMPCMPPMAPNKVIMTPQRMQNHDAQKCQLLGPGFLMASQNMEGKQ